MVVCLSHLSVGIFGMLVFDEVAKEGLVSGKPGMFYCLPRFYFRGLSVISIIFVANIVLEYVYLTCDSRVCASSFFNMNRSKMLKVFRGYLKVFDVSLSIRLCNIIVCPLGELAFHFLPFLPIFLPPRSISYHLVLFSGMESIVVGFYRSRCRCSRASSLCSRTSSSS